MLLMKPMVRSLIVTVAILVPQGTFSQQAQPARTKVDVAKLGPQVGQRVPDFQLPDQAGRMRNLQSIMGSRGAMVVFFRSADW
jgi:hypothetical protein